VTAIAVPEGGTSAPVRFRIVLERAGERIELYARTVDPADPRDRRWIDVGRDLPPQPIDHGVLHFEVEPTRPGATPALLVAVPALVACEPAGRSLLLVTVAGLPATASSMPRLDRFAPTATRFTRAFAGAPTTFPALPQVLTGSYFPESRTAPGLTGLLDGVAPEATRAFVGDALAAAWIADEHPGFGTVVRTARGARDLTSDALRFLTASGAARRRSMSTTAHRRHPRRSVMRRTGTDEALAAIDRAVARLLRASRGADGSKTRSSWWSGCRMPRLTTPMPVATRRRAARPVPGALPRDTAGANGRHAGRHHRRRRHRARRHEPDAVRGRRRKPAPARSRRGRARRPDPLRAHGGHGRRCPAADGALVDAEARP
jgi:hypothetical protein